MKASCATTYLSEVWYIALIRIHIFSSILWVIWVPPLLFGARAKHQCTRACAMLIILLLAQACIECMSYKHMFVSGHIASDTSFCCCCDGLVLTAHACADACTVALLVTMPLWLHTLLMLLLMIFKAFARWNSWSLGCWCELVPNAVIVYAWLIITVMMLLMSSLLLMMFLGLGLY